MGPPNLDLGWPFLFHKPPRTREGSLGATGVWAWDNVLHTRQDRGGHSLRPRVTDPKTSAPAVDRCCSINSRGLGTNPTMEHPGHFPNMGLRAKNFLFNLSSLVYKLGLILEPLCDRATMQSVCPSWLTPGNAQDIKGTLTPSVSQQIE